MDKETKIAAMLFQQAKVQYKLKLIDSSEYQKILTLIYENLSDFEDNANKKNYLIKVLTPPKMNIKLMDTLNFTLALN